MKIPVVPYLTPAPDAVSHGGWHLTTAEGDVPLPAELEHWDYQTTLHLAAAVSVDRTAVTGACELKARSGLAVLVTAHSDHTRTEQPVALRDVPHQDRYDLALQLELRGAQLGGRLTLDTLVVVTDPIPASDLAPSQPGSIIWRHRHHTHLQGIGAQFPTDASDFTKTHPGHTRAAWVLRVDMSDADARFMSVARLTLNSGHPAVVSLLAGDRNDATAQLQRTLRWDVTRQLVQLALGSDEVVAAEFDADATTVAGVLRNVLATVWPAENPLTLRRWIETDPARIELDLQSHCGLLT